jgi:hypothetical protein
VHLAASVITPSDEDSNTFTVNSGMGDMFKLQAADAHTHHKWVSHSCSVAEIHTLGIAQGCIKVGLSIDVRRMCIGT